MVEDVSGGRDPVGCQNQPAKGVQENQRYVDKNRKQSIVFSPSILLLRTAFRKSLVRQKIIELEELQHNVTNKKAVFLPGLGGHIGPET